MKPYLLSPDEGEAIWMFDGLDTIKAHSDDTGGAFSVVEFVDIEGSSVPLHVADRWDRGFYVLTGEYTFVIGWDTVAAAPGSWIFVPRNTAHAWRCASSEGRLLNITWPGGSEAFLRAVEKRVTGPTTLPDVTQPDVETLLGKAPAYGITIVGPPPLS